MLVEVLPYIGKFWCFHSPSLFSHCLLYECCYLLAVELIFVMKSMVHLVINSSSKPISTTNSDTSNDLQVIAIIANMCWSRSESSEFSSCAIIPSYKASRVFGCEQHKLRTYNLSSLLAIGQSCWSQYLDDRLSPRRFLSNNYSSHLILTAKFRQLVWCNNLQDKVDQNGKIGLEGYHDELGAVLQVN